MKECPDCKKLQDECPWKGSVLDHCGYISTEEDKRKLLEGKPHEVYPFHSSFLRCGKHKELDIVKKNMIEFMKMRKIEKKSWWEKIKEKLLY